MANTLKEVLGSLLSEVANARMLSDTQTALMVQTYQNHELMQYFTVPRIEIKELTFELKLAVVSVSENEVLVEANTTNLQDFDINTLTQVRLVTYTQNYALLKKQDNSTELIHIE